jgi:hypothetical protein
MQLSRTEAGRPAFTQAAFASRRARYGLALGALLAAALLLTLLAPAPARAQSVRDDAPQAYVVKKGDTLWGIADMFLAEPWLWPEVWDVNPQIDNPHLIYPGDTIYLSYVDGRPRLSLRRGRDVKLSPQMRVSPLDLAIPVIPLDQIGAFLLRHRILSADDLAESGYVIAGAQEHLITANGDLIYGRGYFPQRRARLRHLPCRRRVPRPDHLGDARLPGPGHRQRAGAQPRAGPGRGAGDHPHHRRGPHPAIASCHRRSASSMRHVPAAGARAWISRTAS